MGREDGSWPSLRTRKTNISQDARSCHLMNKQVNALTVQTANKPIHRQHFCHSGVAGQTSSVKNSTSISSVAIPASFERLILQEWDICTRYNSMVQVKLYFPLKNLYVNMDNSRFTHGQNAKRINVT